jgi:protein TonB
MKRKKEKVPGFDEIIFENRNKEYGAYVIRKRYFPNTLLSIIGGTSLFTALVLLLSFAGHSNLIATGPDPFWVIVSPDSSLIDPNKYKPEPPEDPAPEIKVNRYAPPVIVEKLDSGDFEMMSVSELDSVTNEPVEPLIIPVAETDPVVATEPEPVIWVEEMPEFPGGQTALMKFINENIIYPEDAINNGIEGKVVVRFVVSADGSVKRIELLKGVDPLLDKEALRVVSLQPVWKPGRQNGNPAAVWFTVPVKFELRKN